MDEVVGNKTNEQNSTPFLVLIDTEGFDCDIVKGISLNSTRLPKFLVFEIKQCRRKYKEAKEHLESLGYTIVLAGKENAVGVLKKITSEKI